MSITRTVLPNFVRSLLFIVLAGLSFSAFANHHAKDEDKAAAKVEEAMQKKDAEMKENSSDYAGGKKEGMQSEEMSEAEEAAKEQAGEMAPEQ